jgi:hypothetical protein
MNMFAHFKSTQLNLMKKIFVVIYLTPARGSEAF